MGDKTADLVPGGIDPRALPAITRRAYSAHRVAGIVTAAFAIAGLGWVLLTDVILYGLIHSPALIARIETAKGWIFISLASALLYAVAFRTAARLDRVRRLMSTVVESIADGVLLLGHDRTIAYANPAAQRMLRSSIDDLIGMDAVAFSQRFRVSYPAGGMVPPEKFVSQRAFDEGGPLRYKILLCPPGGSPMVVSLIAAGVRLALGAPATWVISVMHDITDSDQLEQIRNQFFAAAAHSLKTPVAVIKANVQALVPATAPQDKRVVASIERQCDRIDRLVQNLLVLARSRSQTLELYPSDLLVAPLVARIAGEQIWSYRHQIRTEVTGAPSVRADRERLALVIRNFMYEATRLAPSDSLLTLVARPEGTQVAVGVRYHPLPWRDRVSEAYGEYDDIGIGRCVAETIAEGHGGSLGEEAEGGEMTNWIYLPAGPEVRA